MARCHHTHVQAVFLALVVRAGRAARFSNSCLTPAQEIEKIPIFMTKTPDAKMIAENPQLQVSAESSMSSFIRSHWRGCSLSLPTTTTTQMIQSIIEEDMTPADRANYHKDHGNAAIAKSKKNKAPLVAGSSGLAPPFQTILLTHCILSFAVQEICARAAEGGAVLLHRWAARGGLVPSNSAPMILLMSPPLKPSSPAPLSAEIRRCKGRFRPIFQPCSGAPWSWYMGEAG